MTAKPTINVNGTPQRELLDRQIEVIQALRYAITKLREAAPNARDYQTDRPGDFTQAQVEHQSRLNKLSSIMNELDHIAEFIADQG